MVLGFTPELLQRFLALSPELRAERCSPVVSALGVARSHGNVVVALAGRR